jgi:hypothetical protein
LAKNFEGIFGGIFDQNVHLRDSRHAANTYGYNKADLSNGTPRHKFQFFVKVNYNLADQNVSNFVNAFLDRNDQFLVTQAVKNVTMPSMQIDTEILNQYNKKRISQKRINYTPVSMTFHDTVEGRMLRMWEMYYEYYFRDGVANEKLDVPSASGTGLGFFDSIVDGFKSAFNGVTAPPIDGTEYPNDIVRPGFVDNYGYNLQRVGNQKYLIKDIDIFQVHGSKFSRTKIIRPRIAGFTHDTLDYEDTSGLVEMRFEFEHEGVVYANVNEQLSADELERFRYGDFHELANLITFRTSINGRDLSAKALTEFPSMGACGIASQSAQGSEQGGVFDFLSPIVGTRNTQLLQDSIGGVVGAIPGAISSYATASIFGGTVSFQPDPVDALKTTANQISRGAFGRTRNAFQAGVAGAVQGAGNSIVNGFKGLGG